MDFRNLIHNIAEGLTTENVSMIRYLCRDAIKHSFDFDNALSFFEYFETRGWINGSDMSFLAEVLYRINRHDLLKQLPGVKNRKDYEENFLISQANQNFSPFRIACFQLIDEITSQDFNVVKNFFRSKLSTRNYQKATDIISLLVCLEEEDLLSDGDLEFMVNCLKQLDNQTPYNTFSRLKEGDISIILPKSHQSIQSRTSNELYGFQHSSSLHHSHSMTAEPFSQPYSQVRYPRFQSDSSLQTAYMPSKHGATSTQKKQKQFHHSHRDLKAKFFVPQNDGIEDSSYSEELHQNQFSNKVFSTGTSANNSGNGTRQVRAIMDGYNYNESTMVKGVSGGRGDSSAANLPNAIENLSVKQHSNSLRSVVQLNNPIYNQPQYVKLPNDRINLQKPDESNTTRDKNQLNEEYSMSKQTAGICVIINNNNFQSFNSCTDSKSFQAKKECIFKDRTGSKKDVEKLTCMFQGFGFSVVLYEDLTAVDLIHKLSKIAVQEHNDYDCFVLVVMSHGHKGCVYGIDENPVLFEEIRKLFKPKVCPSLENKPKIFFFQACQTTAATAATTSSADTPIADLEEDGDLPSDADFLICHATVPGCPAYRSRSNGSIFISLVVSNLIKYYENEDLMSIMVNVNKEISEKNLNQISMPISTLRKKIFFKLHNAQMLKMALS